MTITMTIVSTRQLLLSFLSSWVIIGAGVLGAGAPATNKQTTRGIKILNESGSRVEVYWIHPTTRATSLMSSPHVFNGAAFPLNSFVGHEFEVRELPSQSTGLCNITGDETCHSGYFTVSENDDQSELCSAPPKEERKHSRFSSAVMRKKESLNPRNLCCIL